MGPGRHPPPRHPAPRPGTVLCRLDDLPDPGARGFTFGEGRLAFEMFVVRRGDRAWGYVNDCPHAHTTLEFMPDRFLDSAGLDIICSTHGARFAVEDGRCLIGPCRGQALTALPVAIVDGSITIAP